MNNQVIKVQNLSLQYSRGVVLSDINLDIREGDHLLILGANGSGKSSLLRSIAGLSQPQTGEVQIFGEKVSSFSNQELYRLVSYMPQQLEISQRISVIEFLLYSRYPYQRSNSFYSSTDREMCRIALNDVGFSEYEDRILTELSEGEKQIILLASTLAQDSKILLLDEPTNHLDPKHKKRIEDLLDKLSKEITIICVTHEPDLALTFFNKVLGLKGGRKSFWGSREEFLSTGAINQLYDIEFSLLKNPASGRNYFCRN